MPDFPLIYFTLAVATFCREHMVLQLITKPQVRVNMPSRMHLVKLLRSPSFIELSNQAIGVLANHMAFFSRVIFWPRHAFSFLYARIVLGIAIFVYAFDCIMMHASAANRHHSITRKGMGGLSLLIYELIMTSNFSKILSGCFCSMPRT